MPALDEFEDKNIVKTTASDFMKIEDEKRNVITDLFVKLCSRTIDFHEKLESVYAIENFMRGLKHWQFAKSFGGLADDTQLLFLREFIEKALMEALKS